MIQDQDIDDSLPFLTAEQLCRRLNIDPKHSTLRTLAGLSPSHFDVLYLPALNAFSERVQLAPASMSHHHSYEGGLLLHTLDVCELSLKLRQAFHLPLGAEPEEINELQHVYTYAVFVLALLHDAGKALVNVRFINARNKDQCWNPMGQSCKEVKFNHYKIDYVYPVPYKLHQKVSPSTLAWLPDIGRNWLASEHRVLGQVIAALYGDFLDASVFGQILMQADGHSVSKDMKIDNHARSSFKKPRIPIQEQIITALRQIFERKQIILNKNGASGWVDESGEFIYVVCRPIAGAILEQCQSEENYSLPEDPLKIFDLMQDHQLAIATSDDKAVWRVQITQGEFDHKFTCLKLETRRFYLPNHLPQPFAGEIKVLATTDEHVNNEMAQPLMPENRVVTTRTQGSKPSQQVSTIASGGDEPELHLSSFQDSDRGSDAESTPSEAQESPASTVLDFDDKGAGKFFVEWLIKGINDKTLATNQRTASLHILDEGLGLVSPKIFQVFCDQHTIKNSTEKPDFKIVQRRFQSMKLNIKTAAGLNIHVYAIVNKEKQRVADIKMWIIPLKVVYRSPTTPPASNDFIKKKSS